MLRPYQDEAVTQTARSFKWSKRVLLVMPTGSGKTRCGCVIALRSSAKGNQVDILVHREETAKQFQQTLKLLGHDPEMCVSSNKNVNWGAPIMICMVETYHKRKESHNRQTGFILIDEAHRGEFKKVIKGYSGPVLGLTATPIAASKDEPLNGYYEACVTPIQPSWLIQQGYLAVPEFYVPKFDGKKLKVVRGEFSDSSQKQEFMAPKLYKGALDHYLRLANNKAICYNVDIEHSLKMHDEFRFMGIKCWHVDGKTPKDRRAEIFQEFNDHSGACVLHNVGVATTGTDIPSVNTIILNRATTQYALYHQMVGRGARVIDGVKTQFKIIDMGGNSTRFKKLGVYGQDVDWQWLFNNPDGGYDGRKPKVMKKSCPRCAKSISLRDVVCPCCKYQFTKEEALAPFSNLEYADIHLMRDVAKEFMPLHIRGKAPSDMPYKHLIDYAVYMGYREPTRWAGIQIGLRKRNKI